MRRRAWLQEKRQWRAQKEEEALKNSVLDTATAARFSTAAALQARGRTGDSAAIDWRTNSLAASPPRNAPADDAAEAAAAAGQTQGPSTIKSQPSTGAPQPPHLEQSRSSDGCVPASGSRLGVVTIKTCAYIYQRGSRQCWLPV